MAPSHYLDHAATTFPLPKVIFDRAVDFCLRSGVTPGRSSTDAARVAESLVAATRQRMSNLLGGTDPSQVVFSSNASEAINILLQGLLEPNDHVVTTVLEHNSVLRPLNHLRRRGVITLTVVPCSDQGVVDAERIEAALTQRTRLVVMTHASNIIGTVQPVAAIGHLCRQRGVLLIVDAAQTAGATAIDVEAMCIDALAFTGHKALLAAPGIGGLYVRPGVEVRASRWGGTGIRSADPFHLEEMPHRLEVGTPNLLGIASLLAAFEYRDQLDGDTLQNEQARLFTILETGLGKIPGVQLCFSAVGVERRPVLSFTMNGLDSERVGLTLDVEHGVACRTGLHCAPLAHRWLGTGSKGTVRFSLGYNSQPSDVAAALAGVTQIASESQYF